MIKQKVLQKLSRPKDYSYFIWRGIADYLYLNPKKKKCADNVHNTKMVSTLYGLWMKSDESKIDSRIISTMNILDMFCIDNIFIIYTMRPGLIIGTHGNEINDLKKFINEKIPSIDIKLIDVPTKHPLMLAKHAYDYY